MSVTILQLQKRSSYEFKNIQDKFSFNPNNSSFALADGTTQSFNSDIWAEIITKTFVNEPTFNCKEIIAKFKNQVEQYSSLNYQYSTNPAIASIEKVKKLKGGTATFIGIQFLDKNKIAYISCGDSNLFLIKKNNDTISFPFLDIDSLNKNNFFLNTEQLLQDKIEDHYFSQNVFDCEAGEIIIMATDALSRFILKYPEKTVEILSIQNFEGLLNFCLKYWESKELEEDDISAIVFKLDNNEIVKEILPENNFSFPKEKDVEFVPSTQNNSSIIFTDMQFQEIIRQFNFVKNDFDQVKKKQKQNELFLMIAISLLIGNLLFTFYLRPTKTSADTKSNKDNIEESYQTLISKIELLEKKIEKNSNHPVIDTSKKVDKEDSEEELSKKKNNIKHRRGKRASSDE
jgi:hypothetical protein